MTGNELKKAISEALRVALTSPLAWEILLEEEPKEYLTEELSVLQELLPETSAQELYKALLSEEADYREEIQAAYRQLQKEAGSEEEQAGRQARFLQQCLGGLNCSTLLDLNPSLHYGN